MDEAADLALSLVSHTNAGKTTLARTLLARDVGEVRDAPHVTEFADGHLLLRSEHGDTLTLWDTPGFGDSVRLVKRLRGTENPLVRFFAELWDRWRDRAFWSSQQALRHVRERSDLVLYLVNAAEDPAHAGYVAPEMELLGWVGKPVLVLLNQLGPPRERAAEEAERARWAATLQRWPLVKGVLPLDAFARCWVQEGVLFDAVRAALPPSQQEAMARLQAAWRAQREHVFDESMAVLAASVARIATTRVAIDDDAAGGGVLDALRRVGSSIGIGGGARAAAALAERRLAEALQNELRTSTDRLIALHGLAGSAGEQVLERVAAQYEQHRRLEPRRAAWLGGLLSGAASGLAADLAAGGFTLGGGVIVGSLLGALGAAGAAHGINLVRGSERSWVGFGTEALDGIVQAALLRYLAVAHFGRGRGEWSEGEAPPHWAAAAAAAIHADGDAYRTVWAERGSAIGDDAEAATLAASLRLLLASSTRRCLSALYPQAWSGEAV